MFNTKKDRYVLELTIEFNLTAITEWLKKEGDIQDIEKIDRNWDDGMKQIYHIDILPNGQNSDMYFHRKKGCVSGTIGAVDYFENAHPKLRQQLEDAKIKHLSWGLWRQYLSLQLNEKPILLIPLAEWVELQQHGKLESGKYFEAHQKIKVPILFSDDDQPKEFIEVTRGSNSPQGVGYGNALAWVSASTLSFDVNY